MLVPNHVREARTRDRFDGATDPRKDEKGTQMTKHFGPLVSPDAIHGSPEPAWPQAEEVIARITDLQPWLRSMQAEAERQARVPQESVERLYETGVYSSTTPARFGGADFSSEDLFRIYEALGRGCGATAWTVWASAGGNGWSTAFPDAVVRPLYEAPWIGNRTCAAGGSLRRHTGTARQVDGGWMVKGAWAFATGSIHASHAYLGVFYDETDDGKVGMVLLPKESYSLRHDWDTIGMAATGSVTIVIEEEVFVPDERFSTPAQLADRLARLKEEGSAPRTGGLGRSVVVSTGNAVGMAEHALEVFLEGIGKKSIAYSPYDVQQNAPVTHLTVGYFKMQIKAARGIAREAIEYLDRLHETGEEATHADLVRFQADAAYIWDSCATAIETLFKASGASSIAKKQPLQLIARNCRAGSMHAGLNVQTFMENYGRLLCGVTSTVTAVNPLERAS